MIDVWIRIIRVWLRQKIFIDVPILVKLNRWNLWPCVSRRSVRRYLRKILSWLCFKIHTGLCIEHCLVVRLGLCMENNSFLEGWRLLRKCTTKVKDLSVNIDQKNRRSRRKTRDPDTTKMESGTSLSQQNNKKGQRKGEVVVQWGEIDGKQQPAKQNNSGRKVAVHWWS